MKGARRVVFCRRGADRAAPSRQRGVSYIELLAAVLILAVGASSAAAVWVLSVRVPASKRTTEMGSYISMRQVERVKAQKYSQLTDTGNSPSTVDWYDKNGAWISNTASSATAPTGAVYRTYTYIRASNGYGVNRDSTTNTEDLIDLVVTVTSASDSSKVYDQVETLLTFGGV